MNSRYTAAVADLKVKLEKARKDFDEYTLALAKAKKDEANYLNCLTLPENNQYHMGSNGQKLGYGNNCNRAPGETISTIVWRVELAKRDFDNLTYTINNLDNFPPNGYKIEDCSGTYFSDTFLYHPKCEEYRASHTPEAIKAKTLADRAKFDADFPWAIGTAQDPFKTSRIDPKTIKPPTKNNKNKLAKPKGTTTPGKKPLAKLKK